MKSPILLLTACVNPNGMTFTQLQDCDTRLSQYQQALDFYITNTDLQIVVCENTQCDFSAPYAKHIESGRLEFLTFQGNDYDRTLGKGYGEAKILAYALTHSRLITPERYVIKVTGRIIIENIVKIAHSPVLLKGNLFRSNLLAPDYFEALIMIFKPDVMLRFLKAEMESINDSATPPRYFETVLTRAIWADKKVRFLPFFMSPKPDGIAGTTGKPYTYFDHWPNTRLNLWYLKKYWEREKMSMWSYYTYLITTCAIVIACSLAGIFISEKWKNTPK